ncbi:MAG TPA: hypothetical protein VKX49_24905 [Bryobacteraceae bacterium]|nr:hypothetical protein [Bryobacteraceae bacterium]
MKCPECYRLEAERLAAIRHYVELMDARREAGFTPPPGTDTELASAEASLNEKWRRLNDHRSTHSWMAEGASV